MDNHIGRLVEISPWGTGFVEDNVTKETFGFHRSMLGNSAAFDDTDLSGLENRSVYFSVIDGIVTELAISGAAAAGSGR